MISPDQMTVKVQQALQSAQQMAQDNGQQQIEPEHFLLALLEDTEGLTVSAFNKLDIPAGQIRQQLKALWKPHR